MRTDSQDCHPTGGLLQMMSGECGHCLMTMGGRKEEGGGMEQ